MNHETVIEFGDALGGCDRASLEIHWRPCSSDLRDALGGHDRASMVIQLEAVIE